MLYDPKWDKHRDFLRFLQSKPADEKYDWSDCERCAIGQYAESIGKTYWGLYLELEGPAICAAPRTFGAAAERLREQMIA